MKIVFLDIDNVLNCATSVSNCNGWVGIDTVLVRKLAKIIQETNAEIVLTSTWKENFIPGAYKQTHQEAKYLSNKLRKQGLKVYDKTIDRNYNRGEGIMNWLNAHTNITAWVVLDDHYFDDFYKYEEAILKRWIWVNSKTGLTDEDVEEAIEILNDNKYEWKGNNT